MKKYLVYFLCSFCFFQGCQNKIVNDIPLELNIIASANTNFIKEWVSTPANYSPYIKGIREVVPDQLFHVAFLVKGSKGNKNNNYNFSVDWQLKKPDGSIMFSEKNFSQGKGSVPLKPMYVMADPALDLTLEKSDPKGLYRLEATVKDNISNESINNFYEFTLIEK